MPSYDVANLVTLTKTNLIHEMPGGYGTIRTTAVRNTALSLPADLPRGLKLLSKSQLLQNLTIL
jgi:hypothetical protein